MTSLFPDPDRPFRLGTRGSPLALAQAELTIAALIAAHGWPREAIRIVTVSTSGDRIQDRPLAELGGKALWTKELDRALLEGEIDCAVHSMKDVETIRPETIAIAAMLPRAATQDRLIGAPSIAAIPEGAVIGTSSPRRAAQMKALRPDLRTSLLRGNVATRLARVDSGDIDATLLAAAGLDRLGLGDVGTTIPPETLLPAVAQGAVGIECRADDAVARGLLQAIGDAATEACVRAERALLLALGGSCHSPIAALAQLDGGRIRLRAQILSEDGSEQVSRETMLPANAPEAGAMALGKELLDEASPALRALFHP
ncbi:porphobilinogen deaminase [Sphingobium sp. SYK-6]|uniref:hydroxymethylbilane synthase n=1 Tax=Sphingobium sp. (strain NBRC 103272 / SYK-6) TaxID=627192 RepID=UPI0002276988|nr:hydroxymethylbilane synthase [Sphingobium sp. SYK-6]BAK64725.1 porphobilinogen deaminase [Sphingobium sp. SYK-6]